jgi:alkylation response protein AidB-like acyl-CoA dehydrogenase
MFAGSSDQQLFEQVTADFLDKHYPLGHGRALAGQEPAFDPGRWREAAALGWTTLLIPEEAGGGSISGNGLADLLIVASAFGQRAAPGPLSGTNIVAAALGRWGSPQQRQGPLAELLAGEAVGAWAHATAKDPLGPDGRLLLAVRSGPGEVVLTGAAGTVEGAAEAKYLLVTAAANGGGDGRSHFLVPLDAAGVQVEPRQSLDLARRFADVTLRDVALPASARVGEPGPAPGDAWLSEVLAVLLLGEVAGAVNQAFTITERWVASRYSFGRPLNSYQEVKHRMADMRTDAEAIEAVAARAAHAVGTSAADARSWVYAGLAFAGQRAPELIQDCIQLHGGLGVTYEHDLHLLLRRVAVDTRLYGTPGGFAQRLGALVAGTEGAA